ncbi:peroxide/acid stress response protein YhcN [Erwiniaceae bacterium BAC15a-03b]|uniref:Peroxide/acid stress response protein YhcN n=1 Tax=Winslowiella arboricola TaxID=2978220 RepID=A0A9J6PES0_9GAMM|nr:peroxide/acid stress response protein YhcN [Winslowiella arboricola]MCU5773460.1 peroxide/acid stress response protein YhcN [Winslowiella arboricola]MCU5776785.1 peroxide/acid stress response protein YhcN [Winslowiella arboricola]
MKTTIAIAALGLASVLSFGASAADLVTSQQASNGNLQSIGTISVSGLDSSPMTIREALSAKANQQGASSYRVIEAYNNGNYHATAEIYK